MAKCEDYPCCGHTDGLGCDWVSPNEVKLCDACAEERLDRPYHSSMEECPAEVIKARKNVPADAECYCGEEANYAIGDDFVCGNCYAEHQNWKSEQQDRYDEQYG